jgi:hypothetical protein
MKRKRRTWDDVRAKCLELGIAPLNIPEQGYVSRIKGPGVWLFKCHCGKKWSPALADFLAGHSRSCCGAGFHKHTFIDVQKLCQEYGVEFLSDIDPARPLFDTQRPGVWLFKCHCGNTWAPALGSFVKGDAKSCGKCNIPKYKDLIEELSTRQVEVVQCPGLPDELAVIKQTDSSLWRLRCRCGKVFDLSTQSVREGTNTCGCRRGIHSGSKYTFADVRKTCSELGFKFLSQELDESATYDVSKPGKWAVRCHCGRKFSPLLSDLVGGKVRSCGCVRSFAQRILPLKDPNLIP